MDRICKDLGIRYVMFNIDQSSLLELGYPKKLLDRTLDNCIKHDIRIVASFGGQHGHQHYLGHFDDDARREGISFFKRAVKQAAYLGAKSFGTCFGIQTVEQFGSSCERIAERLYVPIEVADMLQKSA